MLAPCANRTRLAALAVAWSFHGLLTAHPLMARAPTESQTVAPQTTQPVEPLQGSPIDLLPADVMFAYAASPDEYSPQRNSAIQSLLSLANGARQLGLWPKEGRTFADVLSAFPLLGKYSHALALLDVTSRELRPGSYRLNDMQAAILLRCGDNVEPIELFIRQLVFSYTNDEVASIEEVPFAAAHRPAGREGPPCYFRLIDDRLDQWAVCEWGRLEDLYIISFGSGAWERAALAASGQAPALQSDTWFQRAYADCRGDQAQLVVLLSPQLIRDRVAEVALDVPDRVIGALEIGDYQRSLWTIGRVGRAVAFYSARLADGRYRFFPISDPSAFRPQHLAVVPPQADSFAIMRFNVGKWLPRAVRAYVQARSERSRQAITAWWERYQRDLNVDAQRDVLDQLGPTTVLHTYPPHPLRLPFLCTFLFEISGDPARLERALGKLLAPGPPPATQPVEQPTRRPFVLQARRTSDGIWYWQAGVFVILGMSVTDDWLVVSFSPEAVRENLVFLRAVAAQKNRTPAPQDANHPAPATVPPADPPSR